MSSKMCVTLCKICTVLCVVFVTFGFAEKVVFVEDGDIITPSIDITRKKYHKNEDQSWYLNEKNGHWALIFNSISIEQESNCRHDYIEIRQIFEKSRPRKPPVRYCGEVLPHPYVSESSKLIIRFISDNLWEGEGFNITAVHGEDKDLLETKMNQLSQKPTALEAVQTDPSNEADSGKGVLFYILIGSSSAAFIIFAILLTYFGFAIRRQVLTHETRVPKLHYISGSTMHPEIMKNDGTFVRLKSGTSASLQSAQELCRTGKKRYSRGKKSTTNPPIDDSTDPKCVITISRTQHNNIYVANGK
ncbi:hypothetical protein ACF0H5_017569 [Mactra antiquata]